MPFGEGGAELRGPKESYTDAHWHHLTNTMDRFVCGGDVALRRITLTTCYIIANHLKRCSQL